MTSDLSIPTSSLIVLSIPFFFALMAIEFVVSVWVLKRKVYRLGDAVSNLSCGVFEQLQSAFLKSLFVFPYVWIYQWATEQGLAIEWWTQSEWGVWVAGGVAFLGVDLAYYWWHRLSHEVNLLWAAHVVHHQSEDYNLSVALRQGSVSNLTAIPFYLPLAFLGISPTVFVTAKAVMILYQFWIHTELVPKLGVLEWVLNTPSHHRVHHGINPEYIDKNYAGTLIIWDRLFRTFELERAPVVYGIVKPLGTFNVFWANVHVFWEILQLRDWRAWFARPGWRPKAQGGPVLPPSVARASFQKFEPRVSALARRGVAVVITITLATAAFYFLSFDQFARTEAAAGAVVILGGLIGSAELLRNRRDRAWDRA